MVDFFKEKTYLEKKFHILEKRNRNKFFNNIFLDWAQKKIRLPDKLVCFWCAKLMEPNEYFKNVLYFVSTRGGEVFERPTLGHKKFNKLYQDTFNVELCEVCFHNLDMYNKTGLWFYNEG